jgi:hypothetical protein
MKFYDFVKTPEYYLAPICIDERAKLFKYKCKPLTENEFKKELRKMRKAQKADGKVYGDEILIYHDYDWKDPVKYNLKDLWNDGEYPIYGLLRNCNNEIFIVLGDFEESKSYKRIKNDSKKN